MSLCVYSATSKAAARAAKARVRQALPDARLSIEEAILGRWNVQLHGQPDHGDRVAAMEAALTPAEKSMLDVERAEAAAD